MQSEQKVVATVPIYFSRSIILYVVYQFKPYIVDVRLDNQQRFFHIAFAENYYVEGN